MPELRCAQLAGRWPGRSCATQAAEERPSDEEPRPEEPSDEEPRPDHEPSEESPAAEEDEDKPIRLTPEMRPPGDTSRKYVKVNSHGRAFSVGRRKMAKASVWVWAATEEEPASVRINGMDISRWFGGHWDYRAVLLEPFFVTDTAGKFNVQAHVQGGGLSGAAAHRPATCPPPAADRMPHRAARPVWPSL